MALVATFGYDILMCLATPGRVIKIEDDWAVVKFPEHSHRASLSLVPKVEVGDFVLVHNELVLNRIPRDDAQKILELLQERERPAKAPGPNRRLGNLTKKNIVRLLQCQGAEKEALLAEANEVRKKKIRDFICIHGIIEFSNYCRNDCSYCGLRRQNNKLKRYRMELEEIVETAAAAANGKGYKLLVLQSGEDPFYTDAMLVEMIRRIKKKCRVFIFMSVGDRGYECYKKMKQAGASGVLYRFETSNSVLFNSLHPEGKKLAERLEHLRFMKELGYFIATGSIVGLPGQTAEDLADDILMTRKWANMVSCGPFVSCRNTPLADQPSGDPEVALKATALLRLLMPYARIPVVTAFETLAGEGGRKKALTAGANSLMFNLTPAKYRKNYKIYDNKFYQSESFWEKYGLFKYQESYKMLEKRMAKELKQ
jgi:biotin synthase